MAKRRKTKGLISGIIVAVLLVLSLGITYGDKLPFAVPTWSELSAMLGLDEEDTPVLTSSDFSVHVIDVGQADAILIQSFGKNVLIDAGDNDMGDGVVSYLKQQGVSKIDTLIATHPHADHIGGMDVVVRKLEIGEVIMPKLPDTLVPTTKTYEDLIDAIADKNLKIKPAKAGDAIQLGEAALTILGPVSKFDGLNNYSVVSRLDYKEVSFVFTGDAEKEAENAILASGANLKANVLKAGHHGSSTSSSQAFLEAVQPNYAAISVGAGNKYGHPHKEVVNRFTKLGIQVFRTDHDGSIVFESKDGRELEVKTQR
ncbi:MAG: ComEC/Rec2 family competence protein [Oscillospiraceae bacterium]